LYHPEKDEMRIPTIDNTNKNLFPKMCVLYIIKYSYQFLLSENNE